MDYSNYIKEHPNSLIITNTEEEFVDVGTKLGQNKKDCVDNWKYYEDGREGFATILIHESKLGYSSYGYFTKDAKNKYAPFKRISYSEFLGTTDDYQIF